MLRRLTAAAAGALLSCATIPALADPVPESPDSRLKSVERTMAATESERAAADATASRVAADLQNVKQRLVVVAGIAQQHESDAAALEARLDGLEAAAHHKSTELARRHTEMAAMLAALQRLARHPPVALVALPTSPGDTVRSAILLRDGVPRIEEQAATLKTEIEGLAKLRGEIATERRALGDSLLALSEERARLEGLVREKGELERAARWASSAAQARMNELASKARDLRDLIERIEAERRRSVAAIPAKPQLPPMTPRDPKPGIQEEDADTSLPARGRVLAGFGDRSEGGEFRGIAIATRPAAQVVAPREGSVVFAGPFKGYGQLLIIEHGEGYHVLLAGLSRLDAATGDEVLAGEPVGVMDPVSNGQPTLYVELRRNGQPINPIPWLAASKRKVSG
jgi:septal ring factor EnvC (AmiA/AmiB activator)